MSENKNPLLSEAQKCLLASKGIGAKGNKPVSESTIDDVLKEIAEGDCEPALAGSLIASLKVLPLNEDEAKSFHSAIHHYQLSNSIKALCFSDFKNDGLQFICKKLFNSEDLDAKDCENLIKNILDEGSDGVFVGAALQALRLKRETVLENIYLREALIERTLQKEWKGKFLVDLADPYDGCIKNPHLALFVAVILSYKGLPSIVHSQQGLGPKYGQTCIDVLRKHSQAELNPTLAMECLDTVGIACVATNTVLKGLEPLRLLRNSMVKRSFLATLDKLLQPITLSGNHVQVCGYVHSAYLKILSELLTHKEGKRAILLKGMEGSVVLDPYKKKSVHEVKNKVYEECDMPTLSNSSSSDKEKTVTPENILKGDHYFSEHIAHTASVLASIIDPDKNYHDEMSEIKILFNDGSLFNHFNKFINKLNQNY